MDTIQVTDMEPDTETVYYSGEDREEILGYLVEKENLGLILDNARGYYYDIRFFYEGETKRYTCVGAAVFYYEEPYAYVLK
jgi:hypothetical protein